MHQQRESNGINADLVPWQAWEEMGRLVNKIRFQTFLEKEMALAGTDTEKNVLREFMLRSEFQIQFLEAKVERLLERSGAVESMPRPEAERLAVGCPHPA